MTNTDEFRVRRRLKNKFSKGNFTRNLDIVGDDSIIVFFIYQSRHFDHLSVSQSDWLLPLRLVFRAKETLLEIVRKKLNYFLVHFRYLCKILIKNHT